MTIEARKLRLIKWIISIEDESIISKLEDLLNLNEPIKEKSNTQKEELT